MGADPSDVKKNSAFSQKDAKFNDIEPELGKESKLINKENMGSTADQQETEKRNRFSMNLATDVDGNEEDTIIVNERGSDHSLSNQKQNRAVKFDETDDSNDESNQTEARKTPFQSEERANDDAESVASSAASAQLSEEADTDRGEALTASEQIDEPDKSTSLPETPEKSSDDSENDCSEKPSRTPSPTLQDEEVKHSQDEEKATEVADEPNQKENEVAPKSGSITPPKSPVNDETAADKEKKAPLSYPLLRTPRSVSSDGSSPRSRSASSERSERSSASGQSASEQKALSRSSTADFEEQEAIVNASMIQDKADGNESSDPNNDNGDEDYGSDFDESDVTLDVPSPRRVPVKAQPIKGKLLTRKTLSDTNPITRKPSRNSSVTRIQSNQRCNTRPTGGAVTNSRSNHAAPQSCPRQPSGSRIPTSNSTNPRRARPYITQTVVKSPALSIKKDSDSALNSHGDMIEPCASPSGPISADPSAAVERWAPRGVPSQLRSEAYLQDGTLCITIKANSRILPSLAKTGPNDTTMPLDVKITVVEDRRSSSSMLATRRKLPPLGPKKSNSNVPANRNVVESRAAGPSFNTRMEQDRTPKANLRPYRTPPRRISPNPSRAYLN